MQSAYRPRYSTETALSRVYNDLLLAVDKDNEAVLIRLDYSAAFDTIVFTSYFKDRSQSFVINDSVSNQHMPLERVPLGSVIGL